MSDAPTRAAGLTTALRLTGADVLPLLHRISTASLGDLAADEARFTLFCDFRGRLLHRALVARAADGAVWLLRDDAPGAALAAFLDRFVFRENVRIEDWSERLDVHGRLAASEPAGALRERDGRPWRVGIAEGAAFEIGPRGASAATSRADGEAWERARIAAGRPRHGHEIADAFNPFEVGLWDEVHLDKGCYTGQEVLLRLMSYDSVRRRLARLAGPGPPPEVPATIGADPARGGVITSTLAERDGWIGLAVLPEAAGAAGARIALADGRALERVEAFPSGWPRGLPRRDPGAR